MKSDSICKLCQRFNGNNSLPLRKLTWLWRESHLSSFWQSLCTQIYLFLFLCSCSKRCHLPLNKKQIMVMCCNLGAAVTDTHWRTWKALPQPLTISSRRYSYGHHLHLGWKRLQMLRWGQNQAMTKDRIGRWNLSTWSMRTGWGSQGQLWDAGAIRKWGFAEGYMQESLKGGRPTQVMC